MIECLPESYDKRLTNHLKYRTNEPVIGFNGLKYLNSFALFQVILFNLFKFLNIKSFFKLRYILSMFIQ